MNAQRRALTELGTLPHHDGSPLYVSDSAPSPGSEVAVRVRIPKAFGPVSAVRVRSTPNTEPQYAVAAHVGATDGAEWWEARLLLENPITKYRFLLSLADGTHRWLNATGLHDIETVDIEDFRLTSFPAPPRWANSTVMYQIFPDRFARSAAADDRPMPDWAEPAAWGDDVIHVGPSTSRQFYGGDLQGIIEHLDHLERLGVTMIYLTPVFPARSNHRYDALSFSHVDPLLGGDDALIALVAAAHDRGFTVIGDLTSNHSGNAHEWFTSSHGTPTALESDFYYWMDAQQLRYESWLGVPSLPKFNWSSRELRRRFIEGSDSVVAKWLKPPYNLDGWRIDVANMTGRYRDEDLNAEVRRTIRQTMIDINPSTLLLAEATNDASADFPGDGWHGAMTYANLTKPLWAWLSEPNRPSSYFGVPYGTIPSYTGTQVYESYQAFIAAFPWRVRLSNMNALDTHDTPRFRTHARPGAVAVAFGMSVTMPGIPVVWAGDEFGLTGDDGEQSRSPIPWSAVDESAADIDLYAALIRLRRDNIALSEGGLRWLHASDDALVFVREHPDQSILVLAARSATSVELPPGSVGAPAARLFGSAEFSGMHLDAKEISFTAWMLPGVPRVPATRALHATK